MVTHDEETQAKEFLKRAEIRTMKKDLSKLREADSLKERDKIVKIKTLEEQRAEQQKRNEASASAKATADKAGREEILQKNEGQERMAEKDLKNYATEQERQKIFLFESQRLALEKRVDIIDKQEDPELKLGKNKLLLEKRDQQAKLNSIIEQEKKLEGEQKVIIEKETTTTIAAEKKGLEQARWDLDKKIQDVEKKRWAVEKQVQDTENEVSKIDKSSEQLVIEKNGLRDKILGVDKSLRDIYSTVMAREEEKRRGLAEEQIAKKESLSKIRAQEKEKTQRQQWSGGDIQSQPKNTEFLNKIPSAAREKLLKSYATENEQRGKFLQDIESGMQEKGQQVTETASQKNILPPPPTARTTPPTQTSPIPVPRKKI